MTLQPSRPRIGLLALTLELYEKSNPTLRAQRENWLSTKVVPALATIADVRFARAVFRREDVEATITGFEADGCDAILVVCLTYSPSQISVSALKRTRLPLTLWNVQELWTIDETFNGLHISNNHGVHGTQDLANVLLRGNVPFHYVTSHLNDDNALTELNTFFTAAWATAGLRKCRLGQLGYPFPGMGDFAVDSTHLASTLGCFCEPLSLEEYHLRAAAATASAIEPIVAEYRQSYDIAADITDDDLVITARAEASLRSLVADRGLDAMTFQFLAFGEDERSVTLPFVAVSRMMADGIGFAGEGDAIGAANTWFLNRICEPASFSEIFSIDFFGNAVLMSHMGEANTALARKDRRLVLAARPRPVVRTQGRQLTIVTSFEPGPATLCAIALGSNQRWRIIASGVDILDFGPLSSLSMPHSKVSPRDDVRNWLTRYATVGGPHHNAICFGDARSRLKMAAKLLDADYCEV